MWRCWSSSDSSSWLYLFLTIAELSGGSSITTQIGGWIGIATALAAWYTALAEMLGSGNGAFRLPRHRNEKTYRYTAARFFKKYGQTFLTGGLLFVILLLLCSISSRLPDPIANQPPDGVTGVSYETFVNQIQTGNMRTVTIQGDGMMARWRVPCGGRPATLSHRLHLIIPGNYNVTVAG